ncbi:helix-turn-helix domain-containing protein [Nocardioides guangzhouensis]|uniref:Helix-turn-helix domain-containing protein n=1 Tax=Nocardioides guangzhouensis TaxID=2497878 RepID=A0A4Q4ZGQ2_9ACTN|nr:helix-turn-helix domain-containing protein [Nocardioides guangzhouensis]
MTRHLLAGLAPGVRRSRGVWAAGGSLRAIAAVLGGAPSTISREVAAHGGRHRYRAARRRGHVIPSSPAGPPLWRTAVRGGR